MKLELTAEQRAARQEFRDFVTAEVAPHAAEWDREEAVSMEAIAKLRERGYLGATLPKEYGGGGRDMVTYGLLTEEIGKGCSSLRSLLTVHDMTSYGLLRWGNQAQRDEYLPRLAKAEILGAFALTEPNVGSNARAVETQAVADGDSYVLTGVKKWTTYGQIADLFLVLAQCDGKPTTFLMERDTPGLTITPMKGLLGTRASMLAELELAEVRVPATHLVGRIGFGMTHVLAAALEMGRYSVAWGSVAIAQASLEATLSYAQERQQFGVPLADHQLVRAMIADMLTDVRAARLLCLRCGYLRDQGDPGSLAETMLAKYFASKVAFRAATDAVQIHGANGVGSEYPVSRYLRDAKVMEIIEGSTQIQQITLPRFDFQEF
jgi:glutaryl-CoA dehydrogenase (non-decarboxylating)